MRATLGRARLGALLLLSACSAAAGPALDPHEYTAPTPLLAPGGTVVAHGWARAPLMQYERGAISAEHADRVREWEYFALFTPELAVSVTLAELGIVSVATLSVQDYATGTTYSESLLGGAGELALPATPFESTRWAPSGGSVEHVYAEGLRTLRFFAGTESERASAEIEIDDDPSGESIAVVTRFDDPALFFYENKRVGLRAHGTVRIGERAWELPAGATYAVIDWGRGAWPALATWEWAAASGMSGGRRVGINLGTVHGDDSRGTADAIVVDGVLHKIDRVRWSFDPDDVLAPWHFASDDGRLELTLVPDFDESSALELGRRSMRTAKAHGVFRGTVRLDDGSVLAVDGVRGIAEQVRIAW